MSYFPELLLTLKYRLGRNFQNCDPEFCVRNAVFAIEGVNAQVPEKVILLYENQPQTIKVEMIQENCTLQW